MRTGATIYSASFIQIGSGNNKLMGGGGTLLTIRKVVMEP
jgi:hypothetical protein